MKKMIIRIILLIGMVISVVGLSSCHSRSATTVPTRTVVDMTGKKVKIPQKVTRVADLWHANNQVVLLLGGQQKLVATTELIKAQPWFTKIDPEIKKAVSPFSGADIQSEALIKTKPDVVISADSGQLKIANNAKLPAVNAMYQDFSGLKRSIKLTATILGGEAPKIAKSYNKTLDHNLAVVKKQLTGQYQRPRILHIVNPTNLNQVDGRKTIVDQWIRAAGGTNALKQTGNMISVTTEQLIKADPTIIIVGNTSSANALKVLRRNPAFSQLTAVKRGRVYGNPQGTFPWDRYSAEEALQVLWAAKLFHPNRFKQLNLVTQTQAFYKRYYHYQLSIHDAKLILAGKNPGE
ncbi:ABC transporter substrate-binding protein [Lentilactobacillus farraginis]|uniref:Iron chelating abc transporter n=1 Tax=Lentilactobacillus farraginis DSM 18382 = JCM 14108 TaxID=1423743 RepID=X0P9J7_9LACO|nr:ABC transporter substrate-binding protein [Lentilactobacillus farraginis]KRM07426.1 iron chelating abc transporter [Lentilactobacillus farraginis DSM 18382 = JCM 14108]GAF35503.1 periplasmic binding protein [Lentilactobacillus farraginis DSM 18382 = JCM 14108]